MVNRYSYWDNIEVLHSPMLRYVYALMLITSLLSACSKSHTNTSTCDPNISFAQTVKPILHQYCSDAGCHDDVQRPVLDVYITAHDGSGQISQAVASGRMPIGKTLTGPERSAILCWISNGRKDN